MNRLIEEFGCNVFNDRVMRQRLPKDTYQSLRRTMRERKPLDIELANIVATAMKEWAAEKGVTHFTHWFQPMTGITAEKHESFLSLCEDGQVHLEFLGKELVRGEPDASSFPSGGLRATFEARGYTAWDPTSYAFIKGGVLCVPTAFCSYGGDALDKKTPLLRSMQAIEKQAKRVLGLFGQDCSAVIPTVGAEQEYFLIDQTVLDKRPDLLYCGRTLLGCRPPKGQEMEDHYFGALKPRVSDFMRELDEKLWKLGVPSKTKHNESAPGQHELAPVFGTANIAADHNQLVMEVMRIVAARHGLVCLLHEKPFAGVNGSGKHNNWSLTADDNDNLLEPGSTPGQNARFLLFLAAIVKAVDEHQDLLRISVATAGNDHRLGGNEAPPAIISVFLGDELTEIIEAIIENRPAASHESREIEIGVDVLPHFRRDTTDRNRTSPLAFTGNKFEFRMPGSSLGVSGPVFVINTIVADVLSDFADRLEKEADFRPAMERLIRETFRKHRRILFNGNNYTAEWAAEAGRRGLKHYRSTPEALPMFSSEENIGLFERHGVLSRSEVMSRKELLEEAYCKTIHIEALTLLDMVRKEVVPAVTRYTERLARSVKTKREADESLDCSLERSLLRELSALSAEAWLRLGDLESAVGKGRAAPGRTEDAMRIYHDDVLAAMLKLRECVDAMELIVDKTLWPFPSYGAILHSVR